MAVVADPFATVVDPYSQADLFRKEAFARTPGVINEGEHLLRTGLRRDYYIDLDPLFNNPAECRYIVSWYVDQINAIRRQRTVDVLGIIEKDRYSGGTTGAIRLAAALSMETGISNLTVRLGKELRSERIKFRSAVDIPVRQSLRGRRFAVISDHSTTGAEVRQAVDAVEYRGGTVSDILVYSLIEPEFNWDAFKDINVHHFFTAPQDILELGFHVKQEGVTKR